MTSTTRRWWAATAALAAVVTMAAAAPATARETPAPASVGEDERMRTPRPPVPPPGPPRPAPEPSPVPREDLPAGFASWESLFDEQHRLNLIADRIVAAGRGGLAGVVVDPENHDVRLHWKGQLPDAVRLAVEAGRLQAPVQVLPATHTALELEAEAQRWLDSGLVTDAYGKPDGSGVAIEVAGPPAAAPPALPGGARTAFTVTYGGERPVPLTGDPAGSGAGVASPFPHSRQFDISPYWGGARFISPVTMCSTGFSVTDAEGYPSMLTVGHCGEPGHEVTTGWPQDVMGQIWWDWDHHDIALMWIYANVGPHVYTGPWNSNTGRKVVGAASNYPGNFVCTNGATTGEHCAVKMYYVSPSDVQIKAKRSKNGACSASHGDSGGAVITQHVGIAWGKALISKGWESVPCQVGNTQITGYHKVELKGLKFALDHFDATLRTG